MDYKKALTDLKERVFAAPVEKEKPVRAGLIPARAQGTEAELEAPQITPYEDWLRGIQSMAAELKAVPKEDDKTSFTEGLAKSISKEPSGEDISKMSPEERETALIKRRGSPSAYAPQRSDEISPPSQGSSPGYGDIKQSEIEAIIREEATLRGIDPIIAVKIFRSEGAGNYQSQIARSGKGADGGKEASYGPYQLYRGGGLGNKYESETGRDLRQDNTIDGITNQVRFALDMAVDSGWSPWYGRKHAGVGVRDGLSSARKAGNWS